jgi:hypothetical protein
MRIARKKRPEIDKAAIDAAKEMVQLPNTNWDYPNRRDEVLAVARNYLALLELLKIEKETSRVLRTKKPLIEMYASTKTSMQMRTFIAEYANELHQRSTVLLTRGDRDSSDEYMVEARAVRKLLHSMDGKTWGK